MSFQPPLVVAVVGCLLLTLVLMLWMMVRNGLKRVRSESDLDPENKATENTPSKDQVYRAKLKERQQERELQNVEERERTRQERERQERSREHLERALQRLQQRLINVETFPLAMRDLLRERPLGAFLKDVQHSLQRTCTGVTNELLTGFAATFYAAEVVIRGGMLLGVPEDDGRVIRSFDCVGVFGKEKRCGECEALAKTISKVKYEHGKRGSLAPLSHLQQQAIKEQQHQQQLQMVQLSDKVFCLMQTTSNHTTNTKTTTTID